MAKVMQAHPSVRFVLVGHTSDVGDPEENEAKALERASAVRLRLEDGGVAEERLEAVGLGGREPLVPNTSKRNRLKNTRVELRIISPGQPIPKGTTSGDEGESDTQIEFEDE